MTLNFVIVTVISMYWRFNGTVIYDDYSALLKCCLHSMFTQLERVCLFIYWTPFGQKGASLQSAFVCTHLSIHTCVIWHCK